MPSKTITLSVPDTMYKEMQAHPEINYSELARERISEYLSTVMKKENVNPYQFLIYKDLIFTREKIIEIHNKIEKNTKRMGQLFWVNRIFELDMIDSLTNFLYYFPRAHPFEDGNKRTAFVCTDSFLRLNWFKLKIKADKNETTEDEKFFWQNANQQKNTEQIKKFLKEHLVSARKPNSVEEAINESIKENKQLIENLATE